MLASHDSYLDINLIVDDYNLCPPASPLIYFAVPLSFASFGPLSYCGRSSHSSVTVAPANPMSKREDVTTDSLYWRSRSGSLDRLE